MPPGGYSAPGGQGADPNRGGRAHSGTGAPRICGGDDRAAGPVVLDVPEDICHEEYSFTPDDFWVDRTTTCIPARRIRPASDDVARAAALLAKAKRPLILAGGGIHLSEAWDSLTNFAESLNVPVAHTMSGKGSISCASELNAGLFGRYSRIANDLIESSDCLLSVGCKLGEIATKRYDLLPGNVPLIHLDVLEEELGRTTRAEVALWGDAAVGSMISPPSWRIARRRKKRRGRITWPRCGPDAEMDRRSGGPAAVERKAHQHGPRHAGAEQQYAGGFGLVADGLRRSLDGLALQHQEGGRTYVPDRGLASIGYGLPGAIGAQLGQPDVPVVGLTGDGGFNMVIGELETAIRVKTPVTIMVVNNAASGYVKALQHAMYGGYQSSDLVEMDYAKIADAYGCQGIRVEDPEKVGQAINTGNAERDRPTVIDLIVTRDPGKMLPAVDSRVLKVEKGDRPV